MKKNLLTFLLWTLFLIGASPVVEAGVTLSVLAHIHSKPDGANPFDGLVQGPDGFYYGTTRYGGTYGYGTIFKLSTVGDITTLFSFNKTNGAFPVDRLILGRDANFYGSTAQGGPNNCGTVFRFTASDRSLTTLVSFNGTNGISPGGLIQAQNGNFYGVTLHGGTGYAAQTADSGYGTIFEVSFTSTPLTLAYLNSAASYPNGLVEGSDRNLYGTTSSGGAANLGTVFKMTPTGVLTLYPFPSKSVGANPFSNLIQAKDGFYYGTTSAGGSAGLGTVFKFGPGGIITKLCDFTGLNGSSPVFGLVQGSDGNFYGATSEGGNFYTASSLGFGTLFRVTPTGTLTQLYSFSGTDGAIPSGLIQGSDGNYYGVTSYGAEFFNKAPLTGYGTVFMMNPEGGLTTMAEFENTNGIEPSGLIQASDGNFYGTSLGGLGNAGLIFEVSPDGLFQTLTQFISGQNPRSLLEDGSGNFHGVYDLGSDGTGVFFSTRFDGQPTTTLAKFDSGTFANGITPDGNGNFYGTARDGGSGTYHLGSIFKVTPDGTVSTMAFFSGTNGAAPWANLLLASDHNFYGTTKEGGAKNCGTLFKITPEGVMTPMLVTFNGTNGKQPVAPLIEGKDGNLYGITPTGGPTGANGTIFKMTLSGAMSTLYSFKGSSGLYPHGSSPAALLQGSDGNFYGITTYGGDNDCGTIFKMTPSRVLTTLASFNGKGNGNQPNSLIQDANGNFFGTTFAGGDSDAGVVFELVIQKSQSITFPTVATQKVGARVFLAATASSGLPVTYALVSGAATLTGNELDINGVGAIKITASQPGNIDYLAAATLQKSINVTMGTQTIAFPAIPDQMVGNKVVLNAVASSGLAVSYVVTGPAVLSGNVLTATGVGTVSVRASQGGNANYRAAPNVTIKLKVTSVATEYRPAMDLIFKDKSICVLDRYNGNRLEIDSPIVEQSNLLLSEM